MRRYFKKNIWPMLLALSGGLTAASCISEDPVAVTAECAITSFSVGDITTVRHTLTAAGIDSTYSRTVGGSSVKFNIDQVNGRIYSIDSLPEWVDLRRVVPRIECSATLYTMIDSVYYPIIGRGDSLDFTHPVDFLVVATDGVSMKHYTAVINLAAANPDSLMWTDIDASTLGLTQDLNMITTEGHMYVFGTKDGQTQVATSTDGQTWTAPQPLVVAGGGKVSPEGIITFGDHLYTTDNTGTILRTADGQTWSVASDRIVTRLLAADSYYLYAQAGDDIIATADLSQWQVETTAAANMLPTTWPSYMSYPARSNPNIKVDLIVGQADAVTDHAVVWYKVAADNNVTNQHWDYITVTSENVYPLPAIGNITAFHFDGAVYAIGGDNSKFYKSYDNGITWRAVTQYQFPPSQVAAGRKVCVNTSGQYIWMLQTGDDGKPHIWRGKLNK